jgi:peptidoglycan/LPS O-acetylase OafA/YrhL
MKKKRPADPPVEKKRVLFFDILRILCVAIILYAHNRLIYLGSINSVFFADGYLPLNIYSNGLQGWAVYGLIFVSGAVLQLNYSRVDKAFRYSIFVVKRAVRLYPAFWLSLIFGLAINIILSLSIAVDILSANLFPILFEYTGFYVILGRGPGFINEMGWFIAAILCLYLLYPYLAGLVQKYRLAAVAACLLITLVSRSLLLTYSASFPDLLWRWLPICNLFEFVLGMYIVQVNWYPKNEVDYPLIHELAELSFYVFLFHGIVITTIRLPFAIFTDTYEFFTHILPGNQDAGIILLYCFMTAVVLGISYLALLADRRIQRFIRQRNLIAGI